MGSEVETEIWNLPAGIDLEKSSFRTLNIPGTGAEATFLVSGARLFSFTQSSTTDPARTWTWQNVIYAPSPVSYTCEVDPCFLIAAKLDAKEARTWPEITADLPEFTDDEKVLAFRDTCAKAIGDYYIANDSALLTWYKRMFVRMIIHQKDASYNVYGEEKRQKIHYAKAADFCTWVSERLQEEFVKLLPASIKEPRPSGSGIVIIKEVEEDYCAPPPAKMAKQSANQKRLEKAAKGTASIASFFGKK
uniref:RNase_H2-Ydr279 domain-containing protein n=1 Tax=Panagrellus redivivus TaxID=6233 RepID=A0A7E4ULV8_PANRE